MRIRAFEPESDYPALAAFMESVRPSRPRDPEKMKAVEAAMPGHLLFERRLAVQGERIVGSLWYGHDAEMYHPKKPHFSLWVARDHRNRGIGTALYERMLEGIAPLAPVSVEVHVFSDDEDGLTYVRRRGFEEVMRAYLLELRVADFDFSRFERSVEAEIVDATGYMDEPGLRQVTELVAELAKDTPNTEPWTINYELIVADTKRPDFVAEAYFLAREDGELVGCTSLWRDARPESMCIGLTGVRRGWRRKGLATALKVRALRWAQANGVQRIRTDCESLNQPILALNRAMGFREKSVVVCLTKPDPRP